MKNAKLNAESIAALNALSKFETLGFDVKDLVSTSSVKGDWLGHAAFVAKSEYLINQFAKVQFMKFRDGLLVPIVGNRALYTVFFRHVEGNRFQVLSLDSETYARLEAQLVPILNGVIEA